MRIIVTCGVVAVLQSMLTGCARDPLEEAAMQASRVGTAAGEGRHGMDTVGLDAGARVTERFYYVAKYQATREQREFAQAAAREIVRSPKRKAASAKRKLPRYIAVRTRPDARRKTETNVMIFDVQSSEIVGNDVYDLNETPPSGAVVKFDTYSAQYVAGER